VGSGATVTDQTPAGGAIIPGGATVILYLGEKKPDAKCTVPDVRGQDGGGGQPGFSPTPA
jgi:stage V sporulation protein D (sporulation-specific penicillin-binding protein)